MKNLFLFILNEGKLTLYMIFLGSFLKKEVYFLLSKNKINLVKHCKTCTNIRKKGKTYMRACIHTHDTPYY